MSFLSRIFGGKSAADHRATADELFEDGELGQAKLEYERALDKAGDEGAEMREAIEARIAKCVDGIALRRVEEARRYLDAEREDLAREELEHAIETAATKEVRKQAEELLYSLERNEAVTAAQAEEVTDEERLAAVAGSWSDEQDEEYAEYGDPLTDALLALYSDRAEEALPALEALLEEAEEPCYLWFEVGRARLLTGDNEGAQTALETFIELLDEDEGGEARLAAHQQLAGVLDDKGEEDGAVEVLEAAAAAFDEDYRPLAMLGIYLRSKERAEEAAEVLEMACDMLGEIRPDHSVIQELGLAYRDLGRDEEAIATLESVVAIFVGRRQLDFPVPTAVTLAQLHEKHGKLERAADMWSSLARGRDRENHLAYHLEAARVLDLLGLDRDARRMMERALALAEDTDDAEVLEKVKARAEALGEAEGAGEEDDEHDEGREEEEEDDEGEEEEADRR